MHCWHISRFEAYYTVLHWYIRQCISKNNRRTYLLWAISEGIPKPSQPLTHSLSIACLLTLNFEKNSSFCFGWNICNRITQYTLSGNHSQSEKIHSAVNICRGNSTPHTCSIFSNGDFTLSNNFIGVILLDKMNLYRLRCLFIVHYFYSLQRHFQMAAFKKLLFLLFMCCVVCRSLTKPLKVEEGAGNKSLSKGRFWKTLPAGWYSTDHSFKY